MVRKNVVGAKKSWARAKLLAELTDSSPGKARAFLTKNKTTEINGTTIPALLDSKVADKRNPKIRNLITIYKEWLASDQPRSKGDPDKPPRAGKPPQKRKSPKSGGKPRTGCLTIPELASTITLLTKDAGPETTERIEGMMTHTIKSLIRDRST